MRPIQLTLQYFGSYADKQTIDFSRLGTQGLYLITGDTGSGKTTIFDAILYALYGSMSGEYRSKDTHVLRCSMAQPTDKTEVTLCFDYAGYRYEICRWMDYERKKERGEGLTGVSAGALLTCPDGKTISKTKDVDAKIQEVLGISRDQFSQIAMIAQGDFMKLLMTETRDRLPLFRKIFRTENYKMLQDRVTQTFLDSKKQYEETKVSVSTIMGGVQCAEGSAQQPALRQAQDMKQFTAIARMIEIIEAILAEDQVAIAEQKRQREAQDLIIKRCNEQIAIIGSHEKAAEQLPKEQEKLQHLEQEEQPAKEKQLAAAREAEPEIERLNTQATQLESNIGDYEALAACQLRLAEARKTLQSIEGPNGTEAKCRQTLQMLLDERERLNAELAALGNPESEQAAIQAQLDRLTRYQADLTALEKNRTLLQKAQEGYQTRNHAAEEAENALSRKTSLFYAAQAGILAETIVEGQPCPVCGSVHHPAKAKKAEGAPSKEQLEVLKQDTDRKRKAAIEQSNVCAGILKTIEAEENRLREMGYRADAAEMIQLPEQIHGLQKQLGEVTQKVTRKQAIPVLLQKNTERRDKGLAYAKTLGETKAKALADRDHAAAQIQTLQARCRFKNGAEAQAEITKLRKEAQTRKQAIDTAQNALNTTIQAIATVQATIRTLQETLKNIVHINKADEEAQRQAAQDEINNHIAPILTAIEGRISQNRTAMARLGSKEKEMKVIEDKYQWLKTLNDTLTGQLSGKEKIMLETYILSAYFERIIRKANLRLLKMTNNQYELRRKREASNNAQQSGLDLDVVDHHSGSTRTVKGLSGGESFMASLSLALGLSDEIQSSAGGIHLDTMFVDEGFGSLDEDSRIQARNTLQKLSQDGNRLIGVISHVPELKTIEKQIQVRKNQKGISTAEVVLL